MHSKVRCNLHIVAVATVVFGHSLSTAALDIDTFVRFCSTLLSFTFSLNVSVCVWWSQSRASWWSLPSSSSSTSSSLPPLCLCLHFHTFPTEAVQLKPEVACGRLAQNSEGRGNTTSDTACAQSISLRPGCKTTVGRLMAKAAADNYVRSSDWLDCSNLWHCCSYYYYYYLIVAVAAYKPL